MLCSRLTHAEKRDNMTPDERAIALAKYQADRAHELEVDKVAGQYEVAFVQGLFVLNGGSSVAFITLLASNLNKVVIAAGAWVLAALIAWLVGLVAALVTGWLVYKAQIGYVGSMRAQRHALALALYGPNDPGVIGLSNTAKAGSLATAGSEKQSLADSRFNRANVVGLVSAVCFIVGAIVATVAVSKS